MHVLNRDIQFHRDERAHPRRVEHAGHPDHALSRKFGQTIERLRHGVERIGDRDDNALWTMLDDIWRDAIHDLEVVAHEVIAAHARLPRLSGRDDDDIGPGRGGPVVAADDAGIGPKDRTGLVHVERDACCLLVRDVDDDDVGQFLLCDGTRHRRTNVAGAADHRDFVFHELFLSLPDLQSSVRL